MTLLGALGLWFGTFAWVGLLGFQSRMVNTGRYVHAACTSLCITCAQLVFVRAAVTGDPLLFLAISGTAGPAGIVCSMLVARRFYGPPPR